MILENTIVLLTKNKFQSNLHCLSWIIFIFYKNTITSYKRTYYSNYAPFVNFF